LTGAPCAPSVVQERRFHVRKDCWGYYWISMLPGCLKILGYPINLSVGGCYFETNTEIPAEVGARVEVHLRVDGHTLLLLGVICHKEGETHVGIQFTQVSSRKAEQIRHLVTELEEREKELLDNIQNFCRERRDL